MCMIEIVFDRNCVYQTAYHAVWCPKYRKAILTGAIASEMKSLIEAICLERQWSILALEVQPDHIHLLVSIPPEYFGSGSSTGSHPLVCQYSTGYFSC